MTLFSKDSLQLLQQNKEVNYTNENLDLEETLELKSPCESQKLSLENCYRLPSYQDSIENKTSRC